MYSLGVKYLLVAVAAVLTITVASDINDMKSVKLSTKAEWISNEQFKSIPSIDEISWQSLQDMPLDRASRLLEVIYHLLQINRNVFASFLPQADSIPVYFIDANGQRIITNLIEMTSIAKQMLRFAEDELTIYITGYPELSKTIKEANDKLIENYIRRYTIQNQKFEKSKPFSGNNERIPIEEGNERDWKVIKSLSGDLIIIDLGAALKNFKDFALLDIKGTGSAIGITIIELISQINIPQEMIHIVAQGVGAHIAGAAANEITSNTGQKIHRITALNPTKLFARDSNELIGLSHGDADFVDAIHTSMYGIGMPDRVADVDFYIKDAAIDAITVNNILDEAISATNIFAGSLIPGREYDFPAVNAHSLGDYKINNIYGRRAYIGINADHDLKGAYILEMDARTPVAKKQNLYYGVHTKRI